MVRYVAYLRVSTQRQGASRLGLEAQQVALAAHASRATDRIIETFVEVESGRNADRPQLQRALHLCKLTGATLLIAKLDRLARSVAFIANLMESGVEFVAADLPYANKLTVHILAAMAEYEREAISERTKAALRAARDRGVKLGGDPTGEPTFALSLQPAAPCGCMSWPTNEPTACAASYQTSWLPDRGASAPSVANWTGAMCQRREVAVGDRPRSETSCAASTRPVRLVKGLFTPRSAVDAPVTSTLPGTKKGLAGFPLSP